MSDDVAKKRENIAKIFSENNSTQVRGTTSERVKTVRKVYDLTQQEFADKIEVSIDTIKAIELKEDKLSLDVALRIAKTFDVSLDYLFNITNFMSEDDVLIDKAFQAVFNPTIIKDKYEIGNVGKFSLNLMTLSVNEYLIKFLFESNELKQEFLDEKLSEFDYNFKMEELKDKYYMALKLGGNLPISHVLIPFDKVNDNFTKILDRYYKLDNPDNEIR